MKPPCERDCPRRTAEYRANVAERDRNAYTADAEKRSRSVARLKRMGLLK